MKRHGDAYTPEASRLALKVQTVNQANTGTPPTGPSTFSGLDAAAIADDVAARGPGPRSPARVPRFRRQQDRQRPGGPGPARPGR
ncbi:MAG: hypothetical protein M0C28_00015 [Candidatus Moduliflexus flocculans]|nr:hypothetical protein [Candidatus Moduliflexus flocculans]